MNWLSHAWKQVDRPQARYLMTAPADSAVGYQVAEFAWLTKNWVRPLGLFALGLPCQLMGTGMAFPWAVIRSANLASGEIVEGLKLGLDLALAGKSTRFCPSANVHSVFPSSEEGSKTQRQRWEKGHIATIVSAAPRLLIQAAARRNLDLLALTLDMMIPPLSLLGLLLIGSTAIAAIIAIAGGSAVALLLSLANIAVFASAIFLTWKVWQGCPADEGAIFHGLLCLSEVPLYNRILTGKSTTKWVRTDRGPSQPRKD